MPNTFQQNVMKPWLHWSIDYLQKPCKNLTLYQLMVNYAENQFYWYHFSTSYIFCPRFQLTNANLIVSCLHCWSKKFQPLITMSFISTSSGMYHVSHFLTHYLQTIKQKVYLLLENLNQRNNLKTDFACDFNLDWYLSF